MNCGDIYTIRITKILCLVIHRLKVFGIKILSKTQNKFLLNTEFVELIKNYDVEVDWQ